MFTTCFYAVSPDKTYRIQNKSHENSQQTKRTAKPRQVYAETENKPKPIFLPKPNFRFDTRN